MPMIKEFKEFAVRGNVIDMAVGVVIGAAFGKIVSSLVADVVMPPIGLLLGNADFSKLSITLREAAGDIPAVTLNYGKFINTVVDFTIVAFAVFVLVRQVNRLKRKQAPPPPPPPPDTRQCPRCCCDVARAATRCAHCTSELDPVV